MNIKSEIANEQQGF